MILVVGWTTGPTGDQLDLNNINYLSWMLAGQLDNWRPVRPKLDKLMNMVGVLNSLLFICNPMMSLLLCHNLVI